MRSLLRKVDEFAGKKVLVIGDVMLDRYIYGSVTRISPEAPVPVVRIEKETSAPGGAANTANNIASLGAKAFLFGVVGNDAAKDILLKDLASRGIDTSGIVSEGSRPTIEKTRVIGNSHQLVRIDYEVTDGMPQYAETEIKEKIESAIAMCDVIVISDYAKGLITESLMRSIKRSADAHGKKIIVDPKPKNEAYYKGVYLITPNTKEAFEISGAVNSSRAGEMLMENMGCNVLLTEGPNGMRLFEPGKQEIHIPTKAVEVYDVAGAGDTVVAAMALCVACGMTLKDSAVIANHAAGIVIRKVGTATVTPEELKSTLKWEISDYLKESIRVKQAVIDGQLGKIEDIAKLMIETYRNGRKILVFGNGGSASDAQHFVGELVGRFKISRHALPAIALNTDTAVMTAISNDFGYESIFERQVEALANAGDLIIGISTSGNSENVVRAIQKAKSMGLKTVGMTGSNGGRLSRIADVMIIVPSDNTPRIQEAHIAIIHIICELLEKELFSTDGL